MTSKEALEDLRFQVGNITYFTKDLKMTTFIVKDSCIFEIIEKDLDVLEILKKKEVAIDELKNCIKEDSKNYPALEEYNAFAGDKNSLTQEEFDLLKEWLEDE